MATILESMHEAHKARQLRIKQAALRDLTAPQPEPPPPVPGDILEGIKPRGFIFDTVLREICTHFNVRPEDILSTRHHPVLPRHIMMYLLCTMTKYSTYQVGEKMHRDPTTIKYAIAKVQRLVDNNQVDLEILRSKLRQLLPRW